MSPSRQSRGKPRLVGDAELANLDSAAVVYNRERTRSILLRNGDLFERDLKTGALTQITRGSNGLAALQYSADGGHAQFRVGHKWLSWSRADRLISPVAMPRTTKDPAAAPDEDAMPSMQMRLIATLKRLKDERDAGRDRAEQERRANVTRAPAPIYLGDKVIIDGSALSPDGRWLLLVTAPKTTEMGRIGKLPRYVTESGYEEFDDQRTRVGRNMPAPHTLRPIDLSTRAVRCRKKAATRISTRWPPTAARARSRRANGTRLQSTGHPTARPRTCCAT